MSLVNFWHLKSFSTMYGITCALITRHIHFFGWCVIVSLQMIRLHSIGIVYGEISECFGHSNGQWLFLLRLLISTSHFYVILILRIQERVSLMRFSVLTIVVDAVLHHHLIGNFFFHRFHVVLPFHGFIVVVGQTDIPMQYDAIVLSIFTLGRFFVPGKILLIDNGISRYRLLLFDGTLIRRMMFFVRIVWWRLSARLKRLVMIATVGLIWWHRVHVVLLPFNWRYIIGEWKNRVLFYS